MVRMSQGSDHRPTNPSDKTRLASLRRAVAASEKLELLKLRESEDPTARAVALVALAILRRLDEMVKAS